jgi:hypothetical protein
MHRAIFKLLEIAPLNSYWGSTLLQVLDELDPANDYVIMARPDRINGVLERWASVEDNSSTRQGYFTPQPLRDELLCLIGAVYGGKQIHTKAPVQKRFVGFWHWPRNAISEDEIISVDARTSPNAGLRCAYYANARLTLSEMRDGGERDNDLFWFFVLFNADVCSNPELREILRFQGMYVDRMRASG